MTLSSRADMAAGWVVRLIDGTIMSLEPTLTTLSTYALIEQEDWFEKELPFIRRLLRPGASVVDIGANIGVYTLAMARVVGPAGRVVAVEPLSAARRRLQCGVELNRLTNVSVRAEAIADEAGVGRMLLGGGTETASLQTGENAGGEDVEVSTLDRLIAALAEVPDFIKIDVEGAERRVLAGGHDFLTRHSPVLMVEIRTEAEVNEGLLTDLAALGYDLYRALPGGQGLVPHVIGKPFDSYELNLFACKPERAEELAERGLVVRGGWPAWRPADGPSAIEALDLIGRCDFARGFPTLFESPSLRSDDYGEALAGWATWASPERPLSQRYAALHHAYNRLAEILPAAPTPARLMTFARIAAEIGQRSVAIDIATPIFDWIARLGQPLDEPFLPPCSRYDGQAPSGDVIRWLAATAGEQYERLRAFSSAYAPTWPGLSIVCDTGYASTEMFRRRALRDLVQGSGSALDDRLLRVAPDHLNPGLWRQLAQSG